MTERALGSASDSLHAPAWSFPPPANPLLSSLPTLKSWSSSSFQEECPALVLFRVPRTQLPCLASSWSSPTPPVGSQAAAPPHDFWKALFLPWNHLPYPAGRGPRAVPCRTQAWRVSGTQQAQNTHAHCGTGLAPQMWNWELAERQPRPREGRCWLGGTGGLIQGWPVFTQSWAPILIGWCRDPSLLPPAGQHPLAGSTPAR